jgi:hypothetical protein
MRGARSTREKFQEQNLSLKISNQTAARPKKSGPHTRAAPLRRQQTHIPLALVDKVKDVECEYGEDKKAEGVGDHDARDLLLLVPVVLLLLLPLPPVGGGPAAYQGDLGSLYVFGMRGPTVVTPLSGGGWAAPLVAPDGAAPAQARRHSRRQGKGVEDQRVQWHGPFPREI